MDKSYAYVKKCPQQMPNFTKATKKLRILVVEIHKILQVIKERNDAYSGQIFYIGHAMVASKEIIT